MNARAGETPASGLRVAIRRPGCIAGLIGPSRSPSRSGKLLKADHDNGEPPELRVLTLEVVALDDLEDRRADPAEAHPPPR